VALVTDGRMSGASGKVPSAIHVAPEALDGGLIAKLHDGDVGNSWGVGRELFEIFRERAGPATAGAAALF
jgi:phosphogluconate dehydratase